VVVLEHVSYDVLPKWEKENYFSGLTKKGIKIAITDFMFHPAADIWFDHHNAPFKKEEWQKEFKEAPFKRWQPEYKSCTHQVLDACVRELKYKAPRHIKELMKWADIIDGAGYKSARQALTLTIPAIGLTRAIGALESTGKPLVGIVRALQSGGIAEAADLPSVHRITEQLKKGQEEVAKFYKTNTRVEDDGRIALIDESEIYGRQQRYYPYYFFPKSFYGVRYFFQPDVKMWHFSVGWNVWNKPKNGVDIGKLLRKVDSNGGGHQQVGGMELKTKEAAQAALKKILAALSKKG
jgi:hypothetical protein